MTIQEITNLPLGTKVYLIKDAKISKFITLAYHPKNDNYFYLIDDLSVMSVKCIYIPNSSVLHFELDYELAKKVMWEQLKDRVKSINQSYMEGKESLNFEL